jgi:hypothetical protein
MAREQNEQVKELRSKVRGEVLSAGEAGFDTARTIWNAMIDRKPRLIVRCAGVADVTRSIAFAPITGCPFASKAAVTTSRGTRSATTG